MCVAAGAGLMAGVTEYGSQKSEEPYSATEFSRVQAEVKNDEPSYILGEKDGQVAVFLRGSDEPEIIFNVYLHYLPDVDRLRLTEGIEVYDYDTLLSLIEDYTS